MNGEYFSLLIVFILINNSKLIWSEIHWEKISLDGVTNNYENMSK
ncbi:hypothetical protein B4147_2679 [Bacillus wiedmannii]|uniref:Uncharacterized protein n=1 Tax=Bacillus wiedmannii TaxID=1890302 RepID=A0A0G8C0V1_9BACI|nr:hypothetical protein B4147_2679 [Bacillus wiedmannii]